jgi:hypothetical protein
MKMTGWKKDIWNAQDYPYKPYRYGVTQVPDAVNLSSLLPSRLDQDGMNGCVGAALRTAINVTLNSQKAYVSDESWIWNWNGARALEGTLSQNVGVYPRDALTWLSDNGCLPEPDWPFLGKFDASAPTSERMALAIKYDDFAYYRVGDGPEGIMQSLAESKASLDAGGPAWVICLGNPWPTKWYEAPGGVLPEISVNDDMPTGHEVVIYGYNKPLNRFYIANSWGTVWGVDGLASFPFSALDIFKAHGGYDSQYLVFNASAIPEPEPTPIPNGCNPLSNIMKLFKK